MILAVLLLLHTPVAQALEPDRPLTSYVHDVWLPEDGLPQVSIQAALQSRDGYLWFGTQEGLARFDGARFTVWDARNTPAIKRNNVLSLAEDSDGRLWFGTRGGGLMVLDGDEVRQFTTADGLPSDTVEVLVARGDDLWVGTDMGVARRSAEGFAAVGQPLEVMSLLVEDDGSVWAGSTHGAWYLEGDRFLPVDLGLVPAPPVSALYQLHSGTVLFGTRERGLVSLAPDGTLSHSVCVATQTEGSVESLYEDGDGNLWIGSQTVGLVRVSPDGTRERFGTEDGLTYPRVTAILEDHEGSLWVGTFGGGLNRLRDAAFTAVTPRDGLSHSDVWSIYEDDTGDLWIGTEKGLNLLRDGDLVPWEHQDLLADQSVMTVHREEGTGALWVGTWGQGAWRFQDGQVLHITEDDGLPDGRVYNFLSFGDGAVWMATEEGVAQWQDGAIVSTLTVDDGLPHRNVRQLLRDRRGDVWFATRGGLARWHAGVVEAVEPPKGLAPEERTIYALHEDDEGILWVAHFGGLLRYDGEQWQRFGLEQGLYDRTTHELLSDHGGNLWMSSNRGVWRVSKAQLAAVAAGTRERVEPVVYGREDGMPSRECNGGSHPAGWRTRDGSLWFPTIAGAVSIQPERLPRNEVPPPVLLEEFWVDGALVDLSGELDFAPGTRDFEFHYTGLSFVAPDRVQFRYRLDGLDDDWKDAGNRRVAYYSALPPGRYTFRVQAANADGVWSEDEATVSLHLQPHFTQTALFYVLLGLGLVGFTGLTAGLRIRQLRRREVQLLEAVDARTADLRAMAEELEDLSLRDPLTGLRNRRYVFETLSCVLDELDERRRLALRGGSERRRGGFDALGVYLIDIDHFKAVNDSLGHDAGDEVLKQFAGVLLDCARADDVVVRWGGEEFLVVLSRTTSESLHLYAQRVRMRLADTLFETPSGEALRKTCSIGYAGYPFFQGTDEDLSLEQMVSIADLGMYHAKRTGRDRAVQVAAGERMPEDDRVLAKALSDLEWAVAHGYLVLPGDE